MSRKFLVDIDMGGVARILNLQAPASPNEPARLADLNAAIEGLNWKDDVRAASTANVNVASPGASMDGVTLVANDRLLLKSQTTTTENGLYIWNGAAVPLTRTNDASTGPELVGAVVVVTEGTAGQGTTWRQTATGITIGVTPIAFTVFGTAAPAASETTAGVAEIATQAEVDTGTDDLRTITPLKLANWLGRSRRFAANVGDGSATTFAIPHNFGTRDVQVQVFRNSGNFDTVECDVERTSINNVQLTFANAPAVTAFRVVILF